jgi:hypothetical protein
MTDREILFMAYGALKIKQIDDDFEVHDPKLPDATPIQLIAIIESHLFPGQVPLKKVLIEKSGVGVQIACRNDGGEAGGSNV